MPVERTGERMRAAATASWMARLMPMPPTGDMAWAASPMQRRPGRCQRVRRLTWTERSLTWSQSVSSSTAVGEEGDEVGYGGAEGGEASGLDGGGEGVFGDDEGALEVVGAIDEDGEVAVVDVAEDVRGVGFAAGEAEPEDVDGDSGFDEGEVGGGA